MEIAKNLPNRSVQSVYRHGLRILHPFKRGPWTEDECQKLVDLVAVVGKKWSTIQKRLDRSADSCRDKFREMSDEYVKGRWNDEETDELKRLIRHHLRADPNASMVELGKMVEAEGMTLPWSAISKKIGNRSRLSCFKKFQKMTGIFSPSDSQRSRTKSSSKGTTTASYSEELRIPKNYEAPSSKAATRVTRAEELRIPEKYGYEVRNNPGDEDMELLSELAASGANRATGVQWDALRMEDAQERWQALVGEWQQQEGAEATDDAITSLPLFELAQLLLDQKSSAKMAAETVEAVDLPIV